MASNVLHIPSESESEENEEAMDAVANAAITDARPTRAAKRKSTTTSPCWEYFDKCPDDENYAICKICQKKENRSGGSTTNMRKHLLRKHGIEVETVSTKKSKTVEHEESNSQSEQRKPRQEGERDADIDKALTKMFCFNFLAFLLVENKYFIRFCQALNPNYRLPSRTHLSSTLVPAMYKDIHKKVETVMEDATDVVITTDGWTSNKTENYEALTGHYISSDFIMTSATLGVGKLEDQTAIGHQDVIDGILDQFVGLSSKVRAMVTDNAEVMKSTAANMNLAWHGCIPHTLNLIVKDGLKLETCASLLSSVRAITSHFRRSSKASCQLEKEQERLDLPKHRLIRDVETRWSSTVAMIERFLEQQEAIQAVCSKLKITLHLPTVTETDELVQLVRLLKPFREITTVMSGEKYVTASLVLYVTSALQKLVSKLLPDFGKSYPIAFSVGSVFRDSMLKRFEKFPKKRELLVATLLDPRFKFNGIPSVMRADAKKYLFEEATKISRETDITEEEESHQEEEHVVSSSIFDQLDKEVTLSRQAGKKRIPCQTEIELYYLEENIDRNKDPLAWWREKKEKYPILAKLVRRFLCLIMNSVPCERMFSKMGLIITDRRNCLTSSKAGMIAFITSILGLISTAKNENDDK